MINIDKDYLIAVDLKNTKVKSDKTIFFYNTDLNICNIFIKLICSDEDKTIPEDLIVEFAVLKPETDEFKPLDATLISKEDLLYQVDLTTDYLDIIGTYECEIRVSGTIDNETKCFTSESFDYVVRPNITAKLNNQIEQDKNLPILEKLIKEVNDIGLGIEMNQVQLKKDDNLVGDNKSIVGAINEVNTQCKDIAKQTIIEGNKIYLVKPDGTKLDEGTDLPTSSGTATSNNIETYKCEDIGELYPATNNYVAWCPCSLFFDKNLDKYVMFSCSTTGHIHTTSELYVYYIDKDNFIATEGIKCKYVDSDGVTDISATKSGSVSCVILRDGTYLMIHKAKDDTTRRFISEDNGVTWKSTHILTDCFDEPWQFKELSNGRLICSDDARNVGFMYSDDKGITWTKVAPTGCGGDYEAEAEFLELEEGKLMAIGRFSMSGKGYNEIGDSEPAIISYSNDNGTTWTPWQKSTSITNMNASSCTGIVHEGIVEIFACSRWYYVNDTKYNNDCKNTGKSGAMFHYVATIENAKNDNFTNDGVIVYSQGRKGENAGEFHSPCLAIDDNRNGLIVHMDKGENVTCNQRFIRCNLKNLNSLAKNGSKSPAKPYSAKYTETLFQNMLDKVNSLQYALSKISGSGVTTPSGTWIRTMHWSADDTVTNTVFPYTEGSNFANIFKCGSTPNSVFKTDDDGNNYAYMYSCSCGVTVSDTATKFKLSLQWSHGYTYFVVIKDGYVTAVSTRNGVNVIDDNNEATTISKINSTIEVFDGGCIVDGKEYKLTKSTVEEFASNIAGVNNGAYIGAYANAIDNTTSSSVKDLTTLDYNKTYIGFFAMQYQNYYDIGYWEQY